MVRGQDKRKELVARLEEAEKQHDFYTTLYRQYSADLMKMTLYIRKVITTPELGAYLPRTTQPSSTT